MQLLADGDPELVAEVQAHIDLHLSAADEPLELTAADGPQQASDDAPLDFKRIGPYRTLEWLGMGGMGTVYRAARDDQEFEREVAIKVIRLGLNVPEVRSRFLSERQILATLDHPNIAKMYEGGTTRQGHPYLVMEY
ncbi:MAG: protein kinase, partial [Acidobacteriota bacterium]